MKKSLAILLLLSSAFTFGQKFQLGVKAGANISNFITDKYDDVKMKALIGFHGGVYTRLTIGSFAIQPEALVSTQGAKLDSISNNGSTDWKITYINLPVMLQFKSAGGFYVEAGPQIGFKISEDIQNSSIENFIKDLDFSVAGGFGIRNKTGLGLGARYTLGLSKIGNISSNYFSGIDPDFKNSVVQVSIYIPLTK